MRQWLAPAHLALTLVIIIWNVVLAGRIAQLREASRPFATVSGLAGLLLIPAFIVAVATTTVITGRAISAIDWIWPVITVLFAVQAVYAIAARLVNPLWGYPIAFYDVLIAIAAVARYLAAHGAQVPHPFLVLMAAEVDALALGTSEIALTSPLFLHVPLVAPAFPALRRLTAGVRMVMAALALAWFGFIIAEVPRADVALASYERHAGDRITERPAGFEVGLKLFPDVEDPPSPAAVRVDVETAGSIRATVVHVVFAPGASLTAVDSVSHSLDLLPRDSLIVIASIGYHGKLVPELHRSTLDAESEQRLTTIRRVLRRLRPDILLPAQEPYGAGARVFGQLPVDTWRAYLTRAAALVKEVRPRTRVGVSASVYDSRDSALYAWAAAPGSPIDVVGFSFQPSRLGARSMDASFRAADRWMEATPPKKPQWVFSTGGYPLAHGERSQERAVLATLQWATAHPEVRGLVVTEANDYGQAMGIRAPDGRYRAVAAMLRGAIAALRESRAPVPPPPSP